MNQKLISGTKYDDIQVIAGLLKGDEVQANLYNALCNKKLDIIHIDFSWRGADAAVICMFGIQKDPNAPAVENGEEEHA